MEQVILALEHEKSCCRVKEILERSGTASCLVCRSADQVRRAARKLRVTTVICGYKLGDQSAEALFEDLPLSCSMLVLAPQARLDLMRNRDIFQLPAPVSKSELTASVRMLLCMGNRLERFARPRRSHEEQAVIDAAKRLLMERHGMTEEEAHRLLQKTSMDNGAKLYRTAQLLLDGIKFI